jgi:hypothetical protein
VKNNQNATICRNPSNASSASPSWHRNTKPQFPRHNRSTRCATQNEAPYSASCLGGTWIQACPESTTIQRHAQADLDVYRQPDSLGSIACLTQGTCCSNAKSTVFVASPMQAILVGYYLLREASTSSNTTCNYSTGMLSQSILNISLGYTTEHGAQTHVAGQLERMISTSAWQIIGTSNDCIY